MEKSELDEKAKEFSLEIIRLYLYLLSKIKQYEICKQLLKCGTNIGANIRESRIVKDENEFISKRTAALLEAEKTAYWLELLFEAHYITNRQLQSLLAKLDHITNLLNKSMEKFQIPAYSSMT